MNLTWAWALSATAPATVCFVTYVPGLYPARVAYVAVADKAQDHDNDQVKDHV